MPIHIHTSIVKSLPFIRLSYSDQSKRFDRTIRFEPFFNKSFRHTTHSYRKKMVSLLRFSFETDVVKALSTKIRHFYDLYYLANDKECAEYLQSSEFKKRFIRIANPRPARI